MLTVPARECCPPDRDSLMRLIVINSDVFETLIGTGMHVCAPPAHTHTHTCCR